MRGLIIKQPWIDYTLNGLKPFEIRTRPTNIRERIGLICAGEVWGEVDLIECERWNRDKFTRPYVYFANNPTLGHNKTFDQLITQYLISMKCEYVFIWYLDNIIRYDIPRKYKHPQGAQTWIREIKFKEKIK